ncbi:alpha-ketoacid dehydrogenase subunit beta [Chloroflexota bacterium]
MPEMRLVEALRETLREEMRRDERVFVMGEDVIAATFKTTAYLVDEFGVERVRNTPISESAFVGTAIGAAMTGMRPVVEMMLSAFVYVAMDQFVQNAAKIHHMFDGKYKVPVTFICPFASGGQQGAQHAECPYPKFMNSPGLKVIIPSNPYSVKGLLKSAIRDDNPVMVFIHWDTFRLSGDVPEDDYLVPLGQASIVRKGTDATIVATGAMVAKAISVATDLERKGVSIEVVDPQSLVPLDRETILASVKKTGRLIIVDESYITCGFASEISAVVAEEALDYLDAPIKRVASLDVPVPVSPPMEKFVLPNEERILKALYEVLPGIPG